MFWKEEEENSRIFNRFLKQLEKLAENYSLSYFLIFAIGGNIAIWLLVLFFPLLIFTIAEYASLSDKIYKWLLVIPFFFGTFFAYCLFRLKFPNVEDQQNLGSDLMSTYSFQTNATKHWKIWLVSIAIGVINTVTIVLVDAKLSGNWKSLF
jgi:hypothetical protein